MCLPMQVCKLQREMKEVVRDSEGSLKASETRCKNSAQVKSCSEFYPWSIMSVGNFWVLLRCTNLFSKLTRKGTYSLYSKKKLNNFRRSFWCNKTEICCGSSWARQRTRKAIRPSTCCISCRESIRSSCVFVWRVSVFVSVCVWKAARQPQWPFCWNILLYVWKRNKKNMHAKKQQVRKEKEEADHARNKAKLLEERVGSLEIYKERLQVCKL